LDESNTKLFPRFSVDQVKAALIDTPVVMVTGPRQCGKTTLVRGFTSHRYITLDDCWHSEKNERNDCTWNETVVRFHRPATIPVKYLVITTGDTEDSGTSSATSQPKKIFENVRG
jgi:ABC-type cobalamin/Fe3+-siderophores transport system ATPase subunit